MRPSYLQSIKIIEMVKRMTMVGQSDDELNAFEVKFLKEPLPREEEIKRQEELAMQAVIAAQPKNITLG